MSRRHVSVDLGGGHSIPLNVERAMSKGQLKQLHELLVEEHKRAGATEAEAKERATDDVAKLLHAAFLDVSEHYVGSKSKSIDRLIALQEESLSFYDGVLRTRSTPDLTRLETLFKQMEIEFDNLRKATKDVIPEVQPNKTRAAAEVAETTTPEAPVETTPITPAMIGGLRADTVVSVNTDSGIYHTPGTPWHGSSGPHWRSMTIAEAEGGGYRRAGTGGGGGPAPPSGVYSVDRRTEGDERAVVIRSWIDKGEARAGLEQNMMSAGEYTAVELDGWERAHSQGAGLGVESGEAIRLAPKLVNQTLQNRGIEGFLRSLRDLAQGERIHLTTVTQTHPRTLRLASIHYTVEVPEGGRMVTLFEAAIEVRRNGEARAGVRLPGSDSYTYGPWGTP